MGQPTLVSPDEPGHLAADRAVARWLRAHGLSPHYRPRQTHSSAYCRFLDRPESHRIKEAYDALCAQAWKCWWCGGPAWTPRMMDLHHESYRDLTEDVPGVELVAVHRGRCHRLAHEALQHKRVCGCQPQLPRVA